MSHLASKFATLHSMEIPIYDLNDGTELPVLGLGTYTLKGAEGLAAIQQALGVGYRLLDTAVNYGNEMTVGEALRRSGIPREQVRITSKIPGRHHPYQEAINSTRETLARLGTEYVDLHLIHWPNPKRGEYEQAWQALVDMQGQGLVVSIGVSNFTQEHLNRIMDSSGVMPAVNQVEMHPYFPQEELRRFHDELGIRTQAWSPLGQAGAVLREPVITAAAERHRATPAQIVLRWHFQLGSIPLPRSKDEQHQIDNTNIFNFELSEEEMAAITGLGRPDGRLWGADPNEHFEM